MTNCPNCGAPIAGPRCEYCETVFDISKENDLRIQIELGKAKTQYLHDMMTTKRLYEDALRAMRRYAQVRKEKLNVILDYFNCCDCGSRAVYLGRWLEHGYYVVRCT